MFSAGAPAEHVAARQAEANTQNAELAERLEEVEALIASTLDGDLAVTSQAVTPVFDQMVKRKAMVSYLLLTKSAGSGECTHITIVEVASPSSEGGFHRELEAPSQAVFEP